MTSGTPGGSGRRRQWQPDPHGPAMTKRAIFENVWDARFAGDPNIVEVYIGRPE